MQLKTIKRVEALEAVIKKKNRNNDPDLSHWSFDELVACALGLTLEEFQMRDAPSEEPMERVKR